MTKIYKSRPLNSHLECKLHYRESRMRNFRNSKWASILLIFQVCSWSFSLFLLKAGLISNNLECYSMARWFLTSSVYMVCLYNDILIEKPLTPVLRNRWKKWFYFHRDQIFVFNASFEGKLISWNNCCMQISAQCKNNSVILTRNEDIAISLVALQMSRVHSVCAIDI